MRWDLSGAGGWRDSVSIHYSTVTTTYFGSEFSEIATNKKLLKVTDLLGRETKGKKNQPLFYIYDDGTVEKRITID